jgi:hypothetical protein
MLRYNIVAWQQLGKHIPASANALNNKTSIATQRSSKHGSLRIEAVFSVWSVLKGYKRVQSEGVTEQ